MPSLGRHILIEFYDCDQKQLRNVRCIEKIMTEAAEAARSRIVDVAFHTFNPHGISGVVVIAESHLAIHVWPEHKFVSIDIFTCGKKTDPWRAYRHLKKRFKPKKQIAMELKRGNLE